MLKTIIKKLKNFRRKGIPFVRLELYDLEQESRDKLASVGLLHPDCCDPLGFEFRFEAFNTSGQKVCSGKIDHIPGKQVTVRGIETELEFRRKGYGTSVVLELNKNFPGVPVAPMDERSEGISFWATLRKYSETKNFVIEQISLTSASQLLREAVASTKSNK